MGGPTIHFVGDLGKVHISSLPDFLVLGVHDARHPCISLFAMIAEGKVCFVKARLHLHRLTGEQLNTIHNREGLKDRIMLDSTTV